MHFVGLENFRSILQSPSFRVAIRNSFIFTIRSNRRHRRRQYSRHFPGKAFRGRGIIRFLILLPWVAPISLGAIGLEMDS